LACLLEPQPMRGLGSSCQTIWSPRAVSMGSLWVIGWLLIDVAGWNKTFGLWKHFLWWPRKKPGWLIKLPNSPNRYFSIFSCYKLHYRHSHNFFSLFQCAWCFLMWFSLYLPVILLRSISCVFTIKRWIGLDMNLADIWGGTGHSALLYCTVETVLMLPIQRYHSITMVSTVYYSITTGWPKLSDTTLHFCL